jgi:hypothetical protein
MALKKQTKTQYGIIADYWRLLSLSYHKQDRALSFTLGLFVNEEMAKENVVPLEFKHLIFEPQNEDFEADIRKACYAHAKACTELEGAEDI